jgi:peptidoglycan/LPS O-acetylase OafA/YrhL
VATIPSDKVAAAAAGARESAPAPSPAVAPPPGNPRFPLIDSVRALAVLAVLVYHVAADTGELNKPVVGDFMVVAGVQALSVLFLTSGFLLYRPFARARAAGRPIPSRRRYLRRRMLRILPAFWFALTVLAIFPGIVGVFTGQWWRYYGFLQLYSNNTLNTGIPVAWTLCVEMSFYVLLPVWVTLMRRVRIGSGPNQWLWSELVPLGALALLGIVIQVLSARLIVSQIVADSLLGNCTWIVVGMTLAVLSVHLGQRRAGEPRAIRAVAAYPGACWIIALACLAAATAVLHPGGLFKILIALHTKQSYAREFADIALTFGLCLFLVAPALFGDQAGGATRRVMGWRPLMWIGMVSYGVYLWHVAVVSLLAETSDPAHFSASGLGLAKKLHFATTPILLVLTLAITAAIAAFSYYFVELPFLRRKEK